MLTSTDTSGIILDQCVVRVIDDNLNQHTVDSATVAADDFRVFLAARDPNPLDDGIAVFNLFVCEQLCGSFSADGVTSYFAATTTPDFLSCMATPITNTFGTERPHM